MSDDPVTSDFSGSMDITHARAARLKQEEARNYLALLHFAKRAKIRLDGKCESLDTEIEWANSQINRLAQLAKERIEPRRRTRAKVLNAGQIRAEYYLFLDECGTHALTPVGDEFPAFCLCGVIVPVSAYEAFDSLWKAWKTRHLGAPTARVHEPNIRKRGGHFYRRDSQAQQHLLKSLDQILGELEFTCIAAVIDKRRFADVYGTNKVDDFLPPSAYLMCIDFIFERFVHHLYHMGNDGYGLTVAESRGLREDAEVHSEFLRLHLQGTQWQSESQFRRSLRPYIEFGRKNRNLSGLEIADVMARPIADKVLNPDSTPERWDIVKSKFYDGCTGRKASYGLKVFPSLETTGLFEDYQLKAKEDADASSSADQ